MKRKLQYKQAYLHDTIRPEKVIAALQYLKNNNPEYSDININENWIQQWHELDEELFDGIFEIEDTNQMDTAHEAQISDGSDEVNGYSSDVDPSDTTETRCSPSTEEEKEDMIAMEKNSPVRAEVV